LIFGGEFLFFLNFRPEHPADVKREYLFENPRDRSKWVRTKLLQVKAKPNEQKYKKFPFILGNVQKRVAKNRVQVKIYYFFLISKFYKIYQIRRSKIVYRTSTKLQFYKIRTSKKIRIFTFLLCIKSEHRKIYISPPND